jgi:hypothetical protein
MRKPPARSFNVPASKVTDPAEQGDEARQAEQTEQARLAESARRDGEDDVSKLVSVEALSNTSGYGHGDSGVYVVEREVEREAAEPWTARAAAVVQEKARKTMNPLLEQVTLVVYGWQNVEPGTLSWVFPSVGAAVAAARAMKNAVRWAIVAGRRENDAEDEEASARQDDALDEARANGTVLVEQAG